MHAVYSILCKKELHMRAADAPLVAFFFKIYIDLDSSDEINPVR